jgi:RHS repeat-associated protein
MARRDASGSLKYYLSDHLGSSRVVTNSAGNILDDCDFTPFGQERCVSSSSGNTYKFTGKERDPMAEGGKDYFPARYSVNGLGRWLGPDEYTGGPTSAYGPPDPAPSGALPYANILNPQSLNKYAYVYNNPLRYVDPTGRFCLKAIFGGNCNDDPQPPPPPTVEPPEGEKGKRSRPVVQGKPEKIDKERGAASRQVEYRVVDANGNRVTRGQQVRLDEKFLSGKGNAAICNGPGGCTDTDGLVDEQGVLVGRPFTVERRWQVGKQPAGVRNPKTGNVYDYEVNKNDYDANPPIQTEYHNDE